MEEETLLPAAPKTNPATVTFLPIALYESEGTIFELYQGGQATQDREIHWERLKGVTLTRNNRDFVVEVYHTRPRR